MSKRRDQKGRGHIPGHVVGFAVMVVDIGRCIASGGASDRDLAWRLERAGIQCVPECAQQVAAAIYQALYNGDPKPHINRVVAALRRERPGRFTELADWLKDPVIIELFSSHGMFDDARRWIAACHAIESGAKARVALQMNRSGRPEVQWQGTGMPPVFVYARVAERLRREGVSPEEAIRQSREIVGPTIGGGPERSKIQQEQRKLRSWDLEGLRIFTMEFEARISAFLQPKP